MHFQQRMDANLALAARDAAEALGISRNEFINRAVREAILKATQPTPVGTGAPARFDLELEFTLHGDRADDQAYRLLESVTGLAGLVGATDVTPRLARLATMQPNLRGKR